ncbi:MAG: class I SAM-dependent methyltransferase [Anaerolineales bacterium]
MEKVSCNLCGSFENTIIYQGPDLLLNKSDKVFTLVKCDRCGLIYQNPRLTQDEIRKYYPEDYEPYFHEKNANWLLRKIYRYGVDKRCRIIDSLKVKDKPARLLDIGCSTGLLLYTLRKSRSWEVWGVEPSEYAIKIAREQFQLEVFNGTLLQANYPDSFFDAVTLWDVLEHLPDPSSTLAEISRITRPQSYLVLRIPNSDSLDAKLFGSTWAGLDLPRHNYVFSNRNIRRLLAKNGFEVESISCNIGNYPTFALSVRFWLTKRSTGESDYRKIVRVLNHPITRLITAPFFYFYGLFLLGSEITVVAKKK